VIAWGNPSRPAKFLKLQLRSDEPHRRLFSELLGIANPGNEARDRRTAGVCQTRPETSRAGELFGDEQSE